jgi:cation:H+ antiporter
VVGVLRTHRIIRGVFGATVLAAATSLADYQLAIGDIFGGSAFLPVLFLGR